MSQCRSPTKERAPIGTLNSITPRARPWPYVAELERHVFDNLLNPSEQALVQVRKGLNTHLASTVAHQDAIHR